MTLIPRVTKSIMWKCVINANTRVAHFKSQVPLHNSLVSLFYHSAAWYCVVNCSHFGYNIVQMYWSHLYFKPDDIFDDQMFIWSHDSYNEVVNWSQVYLIASNQSSLPCQMPTSWHRLSVNTYQYCSSLIWGIFQDIFPLFCDFLRLFEKRIFNLYLYWQFIIKCIE